MFTESQRTSERTSEQQKSTLFLCFVLCFLIRFQQFSFALSSSSCNVACSSEPVCMAKVQMKLTNKCNVMLITRRRLTPRPLSHFFTYITHTTTPIRIDVSDRTQFHSLPPFCVCAEMKMMINGIDIKSLNAKLILIRHLIAMLGIVAYNEATYA